MENNKTQAEIYREERKERLAKAAAKKARKSPGLSKTKKIVGKVIAIVLAVVIALGAFGGILNFFGVPQKALKVSIGDSDYSFSVAEYNYYYYNTWYTYQNSAVQYDSYYGDGTSLNLLGYDYTKSPAEQEYTNETAEMTGVTLEDIGNPENPTWADVFSYAAVNQILTVKFGVEKANEAGLTLSEDQEKEIDEQIEEVRANAEKNDYSLDRWFHTQIGKGLSEKILRQIEEESALSNAYYEKLQNDTVNAITKDDINAEYKKNHTSYDILSARIYTMDAVEVKVSDDATDEEKKEAQDKADAKTKANAEAFIAAVKDEESFIKETKKALLSEDSKSKVDPDKSTVAEGISYSDLQKISEELAKWAYDDSRKAGDKTAIKNEDGSYTLILLTVLPHKDTSVSSSDVRHILVKFDTKKDEDGNEIKLTDAEKAKYKAEAQAILDEYNKNPTVENFAKLAKEKTDDTSSAENGGLYENVADDGSYVEAFTKWAVDSSRKPGDTGIVETEYGYHIMYYVKANGDAWYENVKNVIAAEEYAKVTDDVMNDLMKDMNFNNITLKWAKNAQAKFIGQIVVSNF